MAGNAKGGESDALMGVKMALGIDPMSQYVPPASQATQLMIGMLPGAGIAGAMGYSPKYDSPKDLMPSGISKGPSLLSNAKSGNYGDAALQLLGAIPDAGYGAALLKGVNPAFKAIDKATGVAGAESMQRGGVNLGLPMDEASRMGRANEMGFSTDAYHGTASDFPGFSKSRLGAVTKANSAKGAVWLSDSPEVAGGYANHASSEQVQKLIEKSYRAERAGKWDDAHNFMAEAERVEAVGVGGQNVLPTKIRGNFLEHDAQGATMADLDEGQLNSLVLEAKRGGYDGLKIMNFSDNADWGNYRPATHYAVFDPKNIRSRFAKFDPAKKNSSDLLASVAPFAIGGGLLGFGSDKQ